MESPLLFESNQFSKNTISINPKTKSPKCSKEKEVGLVAAALEGNAAGMKAQNQHSLGNCERCQVIIATPE